MKYEIYCDESSWEALFNKNAHTYAVIGGVWIPAEERQSLKDSIREMKDRYSLYGEMKWKNICPTSVALYKELISLFFNNKKIRFRAICIKAKEVNHNRFNAGNGELGFYKFYFQLIHHWMLMGNSYQIFLDYKTNGYQHRVQELGLILNNASTAELTQIQALPSEESVLIQLADVLTGAVASAFNNKAVASNSKRTIRDLIEFNLGHPIKGTTAGETKFNVFNINLRKDW
ncbi:MAG: DUF3800 domain-containing protein [Prevotella sp.]|nr:DUF3800 domain-containing protein [Prevotella sp.]